MRALKWAGRVAVRLLDLGILKSLGGAAIALIGTIWLSTTDLLESWTPIQQGLLLSAVAILVFTVLVAVLGLIQPWYDRLRHSSSTPNDISSAENAENLHSFESRSLVATILTLDLMHVSESYIDFTINVRNLSSRPVRVEGFAGMVRIGGVECALSHSLLKGPVLLPATGESGRVCILRQPISADIASRVGGPVGGLAGEGWVVPFDLSSVRLVGTYVQANGSQSLPDDCWLLGVSFIVKGPVRDDRDAQAIHRVPTTFVSQERYDSSGVRRLESSSPADEPAGAEDADLSSPGRAALVVMPRSPGNGWVHLQVKNEGPRGTFTVRVMHISWPVSSAQWYSVKWREQAPDVEARSLRTGDQGEVDVAYVLTTVEAWDELPDRDESYNVKWRRVRFYSTSARPQHYFNWDAQQLDAEVTMDIAVFDEEEIVHRDRYVLRMKERRAPEGGKHGDLELLRYPEDGGSPTLEAPPFASVLERVEAGVRLQRILARGTLNRAVSKERYASWYAPTVTMLKRDHPSLVAAFDAARTPDHPIRDANLSASQQIDLDRLTAQIEVLERAASLAPLPVEKSITTGDGPVASTTTGSGGIRSDLTAEQNFVPGETRLLKLHVEDGAGQPVTDMSDWRCVFYLFARQGIVGGPDRLAEAALLTIDGRCEPPYVMVELNEEDTKRLAPGGYFYQLWRTDSSTRLSHGDFVFTD